MEKFIHGNTDEFIQWHDTDGNIINASDGGIIFAEGKYHWYGQALRPCPNTPDGTAATTVTGVVMYESEDLLNWKYEGVILECSSDPESELYAPMRFERPKIIYNEKTKQYVLWCHYVRHPGCHGSEPGQAEAGVAFCDSVNGKYKWLGTSRPVDGKFVQDCALFKDDDGSAYFIYDRNLSNTSFIKGVDDRCLHVVKLSDDYLSFTNTYKRIDACYWREAPAIFKKDGYYYMITSGVTGWFTNQAEAFRSRDIMGEWESIGDPCIGDDTHTTFNTQTTYAFKVHNSDTVIVMLERHNLSNFLECSYVWLPVEFNDNNTVSLTYKKEWTLKDFNQRLK